MRLRFGTKKKRGAGKRWKKKEGEGRRERGERRGMENTKIGQKKHPYRFRVHAAFTLPVDPKCSSELHQTLLSLFLPKPV